MRRHALSADRVLAYAEQFLDEADARCEVQLPNAIRRLRIIFYVLLSVLGLLVILAQFAHAGGPHYVAGVNYFNPGTAGMPLTWSQGVVTYYTDQGDLSSILPGPVADALVADAFSQWTSISTAAVLATRGGQLAEDVSGVNVYRNSDNSITMPADIEPSATNRPVGVVYDQDGSVTDALLGQGAGDPSQCFENAVIGGLDNFSTDAHFLHALVIVNGNCAQNNSQLTDVEYRLVRVFGRVLGMDWSQANLNVVNFHPRPTQDDYTGFPVMHNSDPMNCVPISKCYPNPYLPKMDDQAAISRLYPVTSQNIGNFPGKQILSASTARIHGAVYFTNTNGQAGQGMQGVNVVARWIDPGTGLPSRAYVATSVSGFLFAGNIGNMATGFYDNRGQPLNDWGSNNATLEGFFDLAGLQIPNGQNNAQYQLTVEALDPMWSGEVGPYAGFEVQPSGSTQPTNVTVTLGGDVQQDILMQDSAVQTANWFGSTTYNSPAAVPTEGDWSAAFDPYGDIDYFWFAGQANRTISVTVTALDDFGQPSEVKAQPVIGMWTLSDPGNSPAPANTPSPFNSFTFGMSSLNVQLLQATGFRIGISDYRGDGRPDYRYHARVLYGDHVTPTRASVSGGTAIAVSGIGFQQNLQAQVGSVNAETMAASANQLLVIAPAQPDGTQNLTLSDPSTQASSVMTGVLTYGASSTDTLILVSGSNPGTPVGGQAPNPIVVEVVAADRTTPVSGASVFLTASPAVSFSACSGAGSCTVVSDESGRVSTFVTVLASGVITITAQLAPATYSSPQQVQATLLGTSSSLDLSLLSPYGWIAQGAAANVTLTARVLSNGKAVSGRTVHYYLTKGSGTLSPSSGQTDGNGYVSSTLQILSMSGDERVSVCVEPGDAPCQTFYGSAVAGSALQIQAVSGNLQVAGPGTDFQPVVARVTDSANPPHPVEGAPVVFAALIGRGDPNNPILPADDGLFNNNPPPIILGSWNIPATSDANGIANIQPSTGGFSGDLAIVGSATAGAANLPFALESFGQN